MSSPADAPHVKRRGWLKNGNPPGDLSMAPRCGAKTRQALACKAPAMPNGRCRRHGGKSTGPKTQSGKARAAKGNWRHGRYSQEELEMRRKIASVLNSAINLRLKTKMMPDAW